MSLTAALAFVLWPQAAPAPQEEKKPQQQKPVPPSEPAPEEEDEPSRFQLELRMGILLKFEETAAAAASDHAVSTNFPRIQIPLTAPSSSQSLLRRPTVSWWFRMES
jgi:hypothetical protein